MKHYLSFILLFSLCSFCFAVSNMFEVQIVKKGTPQEFSLLGNPYWYADFGSNITVKNVGDIKAEFTVKSENITNVQFNQKDNSVTFKVKDDIKDPIEVTLEANGVKTYQNKITNTNVDKPDPDKPPVTENQLYIDDTVINSFGLSWSNYQIENNRATYLFDMNGQLWGRAPVNVDADDSIDVYLIVPDTTYAIKINGEYCATPISIQPHAAYNANLEGTGDEPIVVNGFKCLHHTYGPYTSDQIDIILIHNKKQFLQFPVKINKLYNVAMGVSFVSSNLHRPKFVIESLTTTSNTINKIDASSRSLTILNIIFYWKPTYDCVHDWFSHNRRDRSITRGRDVLKEPRFMERINPTFGVPISKEWKNGLFTGFTLEFARGGSFIAGGHYGEIEQLANQDFKLGEDEFIGTKDDIQLTHVYKWSGFIGISLDTSVLKLLFEK